MQTSTRSSSLLLRSGVAAAVIFTALLGACDSRNSGGAGGTGSGAAGTATPPASAASR